MKILSISVNYFIYETVTFAFVKLCINNQFINKYNDIPTLVLVIKKKIHLEECESQKNIDISDLNGHY